MDLLRDFNLMRNMAFLLWILGFRDLGRSQYHLRQRVVDREISKS
jgi:hypothetical protein